MREAMIRHEPDKTCNLTSGSELPCDLIIPLTHIIYIHTHTRIMATKDAVFPKLSSFES